ncbi:prepilin-type N-terminal cleavage/methylation domain-containing protein [Cellulomonas endophytica]|uniref:prepilin-type N-terminal cleavage/methylation domain-containing protein n=1 Tax=Cellulomonas endophytica TaxID=2494735 RepID=UPI00101191EB|nr:prepilin-type N-terminal cleavage/methylation domain-containing protein [Cellulomonas endophytica]
MTPAAPDPGHDAGFSLVETVIAMVLLALVALAVLPLVLEVTRASATGVRLATASRLVAEQMEAKRAVPNTICDDRNGAVVVTTPDPRGGAFETRTDIDGQCPGAGVVEYDVWVVHTTAPGKRIAAATTRLAMDGS